MNLIAIVRAPDGLEQLAGSYHFIGVLGEITDEIQFLGRQVAGGGTVEDRAGGEIDYQATHLEAGLRGLGRRRNAPERARIRAGGRAC